MEGHKTIVNKLLVVNYCYKTLHVDVPDKPLSSTICCKSNSDFEKNFLRTLPGLHGFSGCDSTGEFDGI